MSPYNLVLRFEASDRPGILAAITPALAAHGCDIREAKIFGSEETNKFFVRMELASHLSHTELKAAIHPTMAQWTISSEVIDLAHKPRVLIAVSKFGHCLIDLIHRTEIGSLPIEIAGVVSNHETMRSMTEWHGIPYHHLPMANGKEAQEKAFGHLIESEKADLVVLARYMQILSDDFASSLSGRCINIHHSFLPSFKGAKPYHQAHIRGVKLIGATAHYVTGDLDEGPIIEQDVRRVNHGTTAEEMVAIGRDVEASVLSRAVCWHAEHRIFPNVNKTVVLI